MLPSGPNTSAKLNAGSSGPVAISSTTRPNLQKPIDSGQTKKMFQLYLAMAM